MNNRKIRIAKRLTSCHQWSWRLGMKMVAPDFPHIGGAWLVVDVWPPDGVVIPDLNDAGTGGVLLDVLDSAGVDWFRAEHDSEWVVKWGIGGMFQGETEPCATLAEAAALALLKLWEE